MSVRRKEGGAERTWCVLLLVADVVTVEKMK